MKIIRPVAAVAAALAAVSVATAAIAANPVETIKLKPAAGSHVRGTATLGARGAGTRVVLSLRGLAPNAKVRAVLHAGTCALPSSSFATIGRASAGPTGTARWTAAILFRGQPVSWTTVADGDHVVSVIAGGRVVACGAVPGMS